MNEKELLQRFMELAPLEWRPRIFDADLERCEVLDGDLGFMPEKSALLIRPNDDRASAEALIFLLDWLEGEGVECDLCVNLSPGITHRYCASLTREGDWISGPMLKTGGKTRIEAVLRAVVAILAERSTKGHSQTGNERGKSRTKKKTVDPVEGGER